MKQAFITFSKKILTLASPETLKNLMREIYKGYEVQSTKINKNKVSLILVADDTRDILNITLENFENYFLSYFVVKQNN